MTWTPGAWGPQPAPSGLRLRVRVNGIPYLVELEPEGTPGGVCPGLAAGLCRAARAAWSPPGAGPGGWSPPAGAPVARPLPGAIPERPRPVAAAFEEAAR